MDQIDLAQQKAIDDLDVLARANTRIDDNQQRQIDALERRERLMFYMLVLGVVANLAQIAEAIKIVFFAR